MNKAISSDWEVTKVNRGSDDNMNKLHMIFQAIHLDDKSVYKSQSEQCDSKTVQTFLLFTKFSLLKLLIHIESTAKK